MKKELKEIYKIYNQQSDRLEPITVQLEGYGYKTIFESEEKAKEALIANIDTRYKNGSYLIIKSFEILYKD